MRKYVKSGGGSMYFGSVRFFKDLIIVCIATIIAVSIGLAVFFGVKYASLKNDYEENVAKPVINNIAEEEKEEEVKKSLDEIYDEMKKQGYSDDEILEFIEKENPKSFDKYVSALKAVRNAPAYTKLFPDLYVDAPKKNGISDKTIYLTFDDGPAENTWSILSILRKHNVKATFFMCAVETEQDIAIVKQCIAEGHTVGIHSASHDYETIYKDVDSFLLDMKNTSDGIYKATGVKPDIMRFAGGSVNAYNEKISKELCEEVERRGYTYFDWNVSGQDASNNATWTSVYNNILNGVGERNNAIVLLHNRDVSVYVTEDIIIALKNRGYSFDKLTNETTPSQFTIPPEEQLSDSKGIR